MSQYQYDAKDEAVKYIYLTHVDMQFSDEDRLVMAKFLCYYFQLKLSELLLEKRVYQLNVNDNCK